MCPGSISSAMTNPCTLADQRQHTLMQEAMSPQAPTDLVLSYLLEITKNTIKKECLCVSENPQRSFERLEEK